MRRVADYIISGFTRLRAPRNAVGRKQSAHPRVYARPRIFGLDGTLQNSRIFGIFRGNGKNTPTPRPLFVRQNERQSNRIHISQSCGKHARTRRSRHPARHKSVRRTRKDEHARRRGTSSRSRFHIYSGSSDVRHIAHDRLRLAKLPLDNSPGAHRDFDLDRFRRRFFQNRRPNPPYEKSRFAAPERKISSSARL